jgi:hypothetical protein
MTKTGLNGELLRNGATVARVANVVFKRGGETLVGAPVLGGASLGTSSVAIEPDQVEFDLRAPRHLGSGDPNYTLVAGGTTSEIVITNEAITGHVVAMVHPPPSRSP